MLSSKRDKVVKQNTSIIRVVIRIFVLNASLFLSILICGLLVIFASIYRSQIQGTIDQLLITSNRYLSFRIPDLYYKMSNYIDANYENEYLRLKVSGLESQIIGYKALSAEIAELKSMLSYTSSYEIDYITSEFLPISQDIMESSIMIFAGINQGLQEKQLVTSKDNLAAILYSVREKTSRAKLIHSYGVKIPIILSKSNIRCITFGNGSRILLKYLPQDVNDIEGEIVLTSGDAKIFPPGIRVGIVKKDPGGIFYVKTFFDINKSGKFISVIKAINSDKVD
ncbi:Cell shape-determining protein MreC [Candidatus Cyrtobacter comes]|uniref:Cell shape-determining protein MreC n=1 Tax=Candidatus Cyrtobacter comes TaxID=675776 RepID=A0ABU5L899_9RICK|nr:rod shape-determining protein MreC [Candidatus Cyrtobacter comes]MDZ5762344.1 Cell shape-determining protein MreC [Candidatus Cyrtobacter comes]